MGKEKLVAIQAGEAAESLLPNVDGGLVAVKPATVPGKDREIHQKTNQTWWLVREETGDTKCLICYATCTTVTCACLQTWSPSFGGAFS